MFTSASYIAGEDRESVATDERPGDSDRAASTRVSGTASGRRTRRGWSDPSANHRRSTPAQSFKRARKAGCGRDICGEEGPEGKRLCSACNQAPIDMLDGPRWGHFQSEEQVLEAAKTWNERLRVSRGVKYTDVKEGFRPKRTDCLCSRVTCFFASVAKWRKKVAAEANTRTCAVCERTTTSEWRHRPGVNFHLFERYFTSRHATCKKLHLSGGSLDGESWLCNSCFFDSYRRAKKFFTGPGQAGP